MKLLAALALFLASSVDAETSVRGGHQDEQHRVLADGPKKVPPIVKGNLGNVGVPVSQANSEALGNAAAAALQTIASQKFGLDNKNFQLKGGTKPYFRNGKAHVRVSNVIRGKVVEGASVALHIEEDGTISSFNGEVVTGDVDLNGPKLPPMDALGFALEAAGLSGAGDFDSEPELVVVRRSSTGEACRAWKASYFYETVDEQGFLKPNRDLIYAEASTGELCARFPTIYGALSLNTQDCGSTTTQCSTVSTSSSEIDTGDAAIDLAHNYAIATYNYYSNQHGRDSIDDNGMTLKSRVHYNQNYNNAFWDGTQMTYGDGDGTILGPLSMDADVVAHELTHGVTERSSGLIYQGESGALNEAWSDIFGAMVDAQEGATDLDIWKIGEDVYTPGTAGDALRYMYDPALGGDYDWYPTRYTGSQDNGGVHWNSGIANLAFYLLSMGGTHPHGKSTVVVTGIGMQAAADIFYAANVYCLSSSSNFEAARHCTADVFGEVNAAAVNAAWEAVGVLPKVVIPITSGVPQTGLLASSGDLQQYSLVVPANNAVSCSTSGANGDADLYLRFGAEAEANSDSDVNACGSYSSNSNESCTLDPTLTDSTLYVAIHAFSSYSNLSLLCTASEEEVCETSGASCSSGSECCSNRCKGRRGSKTCK